MRVRQAGARAWALVGLGTAIVLALLNYSRLTGTHSVAVNGLTVLIPLTALVGAGRALWLRAHRPGAYRALHTVPDTETDGGEPSAPTASEPT
ncbi:hypothetical protein ACFU7T_31585 [Streptomyces sp. NPDC057555]|uniref:hypothetical protein n=1 Tax=Streptomyces sp. NPDC057555 TaxID=3346166 RepID=UPI0036903E84